MNPSQDNIGPARLTAFARQKLASIEHANWLRTLHDHTRRPGMRAARDGFEDIISFSDNDYLGLSHHPAVIEASVEATRQYGAGAGASRLVTGNHPLFRELESRIAKLKGTEDAVVMGSGYLTNAGSIPVFAGPADVIFADELVHSSLHAGIKASGAPMHLFRHNDLEHLEELLGAHRRSGTNCLIIVDGVYSMDGDLAPLRELGVLASSHEAWLFIDDAHGMGVLGEGRGSAAHLGATDLVPLQMGTLSKAAGSYGGYIAADLVVCDLVRNRCRSLIYTTGLPPATVAAANKALEIIATSPDLCARPLVLAQRFCDALDLPEPQSAIVPVILGDELATMDMSGKLLASGFLVSAIRPPTVEIGKSRLRLCFSAAHSDDDVDNLVEAFRRAGMPPGP